MDYAGCTRFAFHLSASALCPPLAVMSSCGSLQRLSETRALLYISSDHHMYRLIRDYCLLAFSISMWQVGLCVWLNKAMDGRTLWVHCHTEDTTDIAARRAGGM